MNHPSEKYARQNGDLPRIGLKIIWKKMKPPPRALFSVALKNPVAFFWLCLLFLDEVLQSWSALCVEILEMWESPHQHRKMIIFSRENPWLLGKPTILGNPHIISIYFQRDVDIIWCWMLSTPSFSFNFLAPGNETHHFESQRTESEEQTPKVAEAFMASSVMGSSAPFRSRDSQVWYRFWPKHFSWRNLYRTSPAPCLQLGIRLQAPAVVAEIPKVGKNWRDFSSQNREKIPRLPTRRRWSCPVYRKWRKTWSAPIPQAKCALVVRWFRFGSNKKCQKWILEGATTRFMIARYMETRNPILSFGWSPASASQIHTKPGLRTLQFHGKWNMVSHLQAELTPWHGRQFVTFGAWTTWRFFSPRLSISTKWTLRY